MKDKTSRPFPLDNNLTRTDQTARPVRLRVQNRNFRGLGASATTDSGGISGKTGLVSSCLAEVVGKYIFWMSRGEMLPGNNHESSCGINLFTQWPQPFTSANKVFFDNRRQRKYTLSHKFQPGSPHGNSVLHSTTRVHGGKTLSYYVSKNSTDGTYNRLSKHGSGDGVAYYHFLGGGGCNQVLNLLQTVVLRSLSLTSGLDSATCKPVCVFSKPKVMG